MKKNSEKKKERELKTKKIKRGFSLRDTNQSFPNYDFLWLAYPLAYEVKSFVLTFSVKTFSVFFGPWILSNCTCGWKAEYEGAIGVSS